MSRLEIRLKGVQLVYFNMETALTIFWIQVAPHRTAVRMGKGQELGIDEKLDNILLPWMSQTKESQTS